MPPSSIYELTGGTSMRSITAFRFEMLPDAGLPGGGKDGFDVGLVPNAYEATRYLFPNVTVTTEEGGKLRSTTRSSLTTTYSFHFMPTQP